MSENTNKRFIGLDIARAVALLGMFAVHVFPLVENGDSTLAGITLSGNAAPLFAVLAGVSLVILSNKSSYDSMSLVVRSVGIMVIGAVLMALGTNVAIILVHYGILFMFAIAFLKMNVKSLLWISSIWVVVSPILYWVVHRILWRSYDSFPENYPEGLEFLDLFVGSFYPLLIWPVYIFAGIIFAKAALKNRNLLKRIVLYSAGSFIALDIILGKIIALLHLDIRETLLSSNYYSDGVLLSEIETGAQNAYLEQSPLWFFLATPHSESHVNVLSSIALSFFVIALCLLIFDYNKKSISAVLHKISFPFWMMGRMPLTLYSLHIVILAIIMYLEIDVSNIFLFCLIVASCFGFALLFYTFDKKKQGPLEKAIGLASDKMVSNRKT